jgi:hypothetical protein
VLNASKQSTSEKGKGRRDPDIDETSQACLAAVVFLKTGAKNLRQDRPPPRSGVILLKFSMNFITMKAGVNRESF